MGVVGPSPGTAPKRAARSPGRTLRVVLLLLALGALSVWFALRPTEGPARSIRGAGEPFPSRSERAVEAPDSPFPSAAGPTELPPVLVESWGEPRRIRPLRSRALAMPRTLGRYSVDPFDDAQGAWLDGKRHGTWRAQWPAGGPRVEFTWSRGRLEGPVTSWHPDGREELRGAYVAGKREGAWAWWHPDGARAAVEEYRAGRFHGEIVHWHPSGQLAACGRFVEGLPDGPLRFHDGDGSLREVQEWRLGVPCGVWTRYDADGRATCRVTMGAGEPGRH